MAGKAVRGGKGPVMRKDVGRRRRQSRVWGSLPPGKDAAHRVRCSVRARAFGVLGGLKGQ